MDTSKTLIDFPKYGISKKGIIKNLKTGLILKYNKDKDGYFKIVLRDKYNIKKNVFVHRLMVLTYLDNPYNKKVINHKDGVKTNNNIDNLEWSTVQENTIHAYENKLNSLAVTVEVLDIENNIKYRYRSLQHAAEKLNVHLKLLISYIKYSNQHPFNNRYIITIINENEFIKNLNSINFGKTKYLFDVIKNDVTSYNSIGMMRYDTGIRSICELKYNTLLKLGYILSEEEFKTKPIVNIKKEDIIENRNKYLSKPYMSRTYSGVIKNLFNNYEYNFNSKEELNSYFLNKYNIVNANTLIGGVKYRYNNLDKLFLGYSVRYYNSDNKLPDVGTYTIEQVINSANNKILSSPVYKLIINGNIEYVSTLLNLINRLENYFVEKDLVFKKPLRTIDIDFLINNIKSNVNVEIYRCDTIKI